MSLSAARQRTEDREFPFTEREFRFLAALVYEHAGIVLGDNKLNMVYSRLARRLRELGLGSFSEYCQLLQGPRGPDERSAFINSITTNLTKFFRESHHFDHLRQTLQSDSARLAKSGRLRIWSAGCSSGEEPYSIAMTLREAMPNLASLDARILATDLDTQMIEKCIAGHYARTGVAEVPARLRSDYFDDHDRDTVSVDDRLRRMITFKQLNLLGPWPMRGPFDAIFCRNVMIYFDGPTKQTLVDRFSTLLRPGGFLYIGHSETLLDQRSIFAPIGRTIYRKGEA